MQEHRIISNASEDPAGFSIFVHSPAEADVPTIINIPGYDADIDGYNRKYVTLGNDLARRGFEFVRMPNITRPLKQYSRGLLQDVRAVIEFLSRDVGGRQQPIYLMGFSAGGYAAAKIAAENPHVTKVLLMEPSLSTKLFGNEVSLWSLGRFDGEVYIVLGDRDGVGMEVGRTYEQAFGNASRCELMVIPDCDHQFKGKRNGQIMAKAPLWAFAGDTTFPSPEGGLVLYD